MSSKIKHYRPMKLLALSFLVIFSFNSFARDYPLHPDPRLTPGSFCDEPVEYRYPEQIAYCGRDVSTHLKNNIFELYRNNFGHRFPGERLDYKIDHFIPLCAGGSNEADNLWPQHISISQATDPIEALGCEKLAKGYITQRDLVNLIYQAKMNTNLAPNVFRILQELK